ncbi:hypothetical protein D3C75_914590 [compost metagenome]
MHAVSRSQIGIFSACGIQDQLGQRYIAVHHVQLQLMGTCRQFRQLGPQLLSVIHDAVLPISFPFVGSSRLGYEGLGVIDTNRTADPAGRIQRKETVQLQNILPAVR